MTFGGVFELREPEMFAFGLSGCRVKPRRHQVWPAPSLARFCFGRPVGPGHEKSTKGPPRERRKNENCGGRGKKRDFFGSGGRGGSGGGPNLGHTHENFKHTPHRHNTTQHNTTQHNTTQHNTTQHNTTQQTLEIGLSRSKLFGPNSNWPKSNWRKSSILDQLGLQVETQSPLIVASPIPGTPDSHSPFAGVSSPALCVCSFYAPHVGIASDTRKFWRTLAASVHRVSEVHTGIPLLLVPDSNGYGQLWPNYFWPKPSVAKPIFFVTKNSCFHVLSHFPCLAYVGITQDTRPSPGPPFPGPPFPWTAQNFALFFPLPPQFSFFLLWGVLSVVFLNAASLKCSRLGSRAVV